MSSKITKRKAPVIGGQDKAAISRKAANIKRPHIEGILTPGDLPNVLGDVDYQGDIAHDTKEEEGTILKALKASEKADKRRFEVAVDSEFWAAIYFQSREQKEAFLTAMGWLLYGDKYLNGLQLAEHQGIILPNEVLQSKTRSAGRLATRAMDLDQINQDGGDESSN